MALAPLANMTWRTFIDIFAGEFAEHPNGKKAVIWLRECIKGLRPLPDRLRLARKRARRTAAEPETEDEASDSEPEDGKRKAPPPSPSERSFFDSGEHDVGDGARDLDGANRKDAEASGLSPSQSPRARS